MIDIVVDELIINVNNDSDDTTSVFPTSTMMIMMKEHYQVSSYQNFNDKFSY
jgi:hypothetical protein